MKIKFEKSIPENLVEPYNFTTHDMTSNIVNKILQFLYENVKNVFFQDFLSI